MSDPRVVRGFVGKSDLSDLEKGCYCTVQATPEWNNETPVAILPHHEKGVGPLEGWMVGFLRRLASDVSALQLKLSGSISTDAEENKKIWDDRQGVPELKQIAAAISEILGEDDEA